MDDKEKSDRDRFFAIHSRIKAIEEKFNDGLVDDDVFCEKISQDDRQFYQFTLSKISRCITRYRLNGMDWLADSIELEYFGELLYE
ncbi:MAG: hypothetical protein ACRCX2_18520 [Paraclostridium sp.]